MSVAAVEHLPDQEAQQHQNDGILSSDRAFTELSNSLDSISNDIAASMKAFKDVVMTAPLQPEKLSEQNQVTVQKIGAFLTLLDDVDERSLVNVGVSAETAFQKFAEHKMSLLEAIVQLNMATAWAAESAIQSSHAVLDVAESLNLLNKAVTDVVAAIKPLLDAWKNRKHPVSAKLLPLAASIIRSDTADSDSMGMESNADERKASKLSKVLGDGMNQGKISKFFGNDLSPGELQRIQEARKYWFLKYNPDPNTVLFSMEGTLKGATLSSLIERIACHENPDPKLQHMILLTYRCFSSSDEVIESLKKLFNSSPPDNLSKHELEMWNEKRLKVMRLRVINMVKAWLESYFYDQNDRMALPKIKDFASNQIKAIWPTSAAPILKLIEKHESQAISLARQTSQQAAMPRSSKLSEMFDVLKLDAIEVAAQLTLIEFASYNRIRDIEFVGKAWSSKENVTLAPNICYMIQTANQVTGWTASTILGEKDMSRRASLVKHFIAIAEHCRQLNNFNTLMAILAAFNSSPIHRLKSSFDLASISAKTTLNDLQKLMASGQNFGNYRNKLRQCSKPCIPFLGLFLTDLTFIEDGNTNTVKARPNLVNVDKYQKLADKIWEIAEFRTVAYTMAENPELQTLLKARLAKSSHDTDVLYEQSLQLEPRVSEEERLIRVMEESFHQSGLF